MDAIDITALRQLLIQRGDAVWVVWMSPQDLPIKRGMNIPMHYCFARPVDKHARSSLDTHVLKKCMQLRFRMSCHHPSKDEGSCSDPKVRI